MTSSFFCKLIERLLKFGIVAIENIIGSISVNWLLEISMASMLEKHDKSLGKDKILFPDKFNSLRLLN